MRVVESIIPYSLRGGCRIRVWRETDSVRNLNTYANPDIEKLLDESTAVDLHVIAQMVAELPRVNAVEVTDQFGNGIVIYPEWP